MTIAKTLPSERKHFFGLLFHTFQEPLSEGGVSTIRETVVYPCPFPGSGAHIKKSLVVGMSECEPVSADAIPSIRKKVSRAALKLRLNLLSLSCDQAITAFPESIADEPVYCHLLNPIDILNPHHPPNSDVSGTTCTSDISKPDIRPQPPVQSASIFARTASASPIRREY